MLNHTKHVCSSDLLFYQEVIKLKRMFIANCCPLYFLDNILLRFFDSIPITKNSDDPNDDCSYNITIPYFGKKSQKFVQYITKLIKIKFGKKKLLSIKRSK